GAPWPPAWRTPTPRTPPARTVARRRSTSGWRSRRNRPAAGAWEKRAGTSVDEAGSWPAASPRTDDGPRPLPAAKGEGEDVPRCDRRCSEWSGLGPARAGRGVASSSPSLRRGWGLVLRRRPAELGHGGGSPPRRFRIPGHGAVVEPEVPGLVVDHHPQGLGPLG